MELYDYHDEPSIHIKPSIMSQVQLHGLLTT